MKSRIQVLRDESWNEILSRCNKDKVPPWQMLNRIKRSRAPHKPTALRDQHKHVYHPLDKARVLASALENRFTKHNLAPPNHEYEINQSVNNFLSADFPNDFPDFRISELRGLIKNLKSICAFGYDKIPNLVLHNLTRRPLIHLLNIFKNCIKFNYFPEIWKIAKIIILPKPARIRPYQIT